MRLLWDLERIGSGRDGLEGLASHGCGVVDREFYEKLETVKRPSDVGMLKLECIFW